MTIIVKNSLFQQNVWYGFFGFMSIVVAENYYSLKWVFVLGLLYDLSFSRNINFNASYDLSE